VYTRNKMSRRAGTGLSFGFGVGKAADNFPLKKVNMLLNLTKVLDRSFGWG